jgi:hypothetical protein
MVRNLEARNWVAPVPFGTGLSPLGRDRGQVRVVADDRHEARLADQRSRRRGRLR